MPNLPVKKLPVKNWIQIFVIWTLPALSMSIQYYLNNKSNEQDLNFIVIFIKQLPSWYLCALLTPVVIYFYEIFPLDSALWKKNLQHQIFIAFFILIIFAHPRILAMNIITGQSIADMSAGKYLNAFLSQVAWDTAIYAFIISVIFADKANSKRRENELQATRIQVQNIELQNQLRSSQLRALKLQLSPHFLFNTLNTVSSLIRSGENDTAIKVNSKLAEFLRTTLYTDNQEFVTLDKELEFINLYLDIESLRFNDRLKIRKNIPLNTRKFEVPYFLLQPLVENAIKHGIAKKSSASLISIDAEEINGFLIISIFNEGYFLKEPDLSAKDQGIGIMNVVDRLEKIYSDQYDFRIFNDESAQGVKVRISIPKSNRL